MPTPVTLDRYAEIRAEMEAGALRDEVLARAGLSVDDWTAAQRQWLENMGAEIERGRFELTNRYSQAFLARQRALTAPSAPVAKPAVQAAPSAPVIASPPLVEAKPTFLAAGAAADPPGPSMPVVKPPSPLLSGTMSVDVSAFRPALPFDPNAPPAPAPPVKRAPAALSGTSMGQILPKAPALPFAPNAPTAPDTKPPTESPRSPVLPAVKRAPAELSGTSMAFVAPKGPALPFAATDEKQPSAPAAPPAPPAPSAPAVKRAPAALSGTSMGFVAPKGPALPFAKGNAPPAPPPPESKHASPTPATAPAAALEPPRAAAAPEGPPNGLSLEQYASLCVELGAEPAKASEIFRRYGLTPEQGLAVDAYWKQRVGADPALRAAFDRAHNAYKAWLEAARARARGPG